MHPPPESHSCLINQLPFELLSLVLEIGVARQRREDENNHYSSQSSDPIPLPPFQLVASHVCHYWRNVAFNTPSLWSTIFFYRLARPLPQLVSLLMELSDSLAIDIHINPRKRWISDDPLQFPYHLILPHVHRWRSLKVTFERQDHEITFLKSLSRPSVSAPSQLETVALRVEDHRLGPSTSKRFTLFNGSAPRLTTIILWGVLVDWNQPWIASAVNLATLELGYHSEYHRPTWEQFSTALGGAPALRRLVLCSSGPAGMPIEWVTMTTNDNPLTANLHSPVPLLNLTEFLLALDCPARAIGYLRKFHMPALKYLSLDLRNADYTEFIQELVGPATPITPSSAEERPSGSLLRNLEELNIFALTCHPVTQQSLYDELQSVKRLRIPMMQGPIHPCMFAALLLPCQRAQEAVSLPCLKELTICFDYYNYTLVREVVRERKDAGCPLMSLTFGQAFGLGEESRWFEENVENFFPVSNVVRGDHDPWRRMFTGERVQGLGDCSCV